MATNKIRKKILSASAMLLLSASMLGTSTFAWFTMSREVTVSGMEIRTKVSSNLLISETNVEADYSSLELAQIRKALVEPVSTVTATNTGFFYTLDAAADGHKVQDTTDDPYVAYSESTTLTAEDTYANKTNYDANFNTKYGVTTANTSGECKTAYAYVDYVFYLKATTDAANQSINMTRCNFIWEDEGTDTELAATDTAWRVAVFAEDITSDGGTGEVDTDPATGTAIAIITPENAENFTDGQAVSSTTALGTVTYGDEVIIDTIATPASKYYKVVVRIWLEGEDTNCYSSYYADKLELYKVDLAFELGKGNPVTNIGSSLDAFVPAETN